MAACAERVLSETGATPRLHFIEQRSEPRFEGLGASGTIVFRGASYPAPIVNISSRGTQIESDIAPRLGESVIIHFDGCSPIQAFVRWARDGRIGLNFGCELIVG
jgi:PilZ domain